MAAHSTQDATTSIGSNCWTLRAGIAGLVNVAYLRLGCGPIEAALRA